MTDPSIPLQVRVPTPADPMQQYAQAQAIRGQIQQQQMGQQALKSGALDLQQKQIQLDIQKNIAKSYEEAAAEMQAPAASPSSTNTAPSGARPASPATPPPAASPQSAPPPDDTTPAEAPPPSAMALSRGTTDNAVPPPGPEATGPESGPPSAMAIPAQVPTPAPQPDASTPPQAPAPSAMAMPAASAGPMSVSGAASPAGPVSLSSMAAPPSTGGQSAAVRSTSPQAANPPANAPSAPAPVPENFHAALVRRLYANHVGQMVPGISKAYTDMQISQAKALADQSDAHAKVASQAAQLINGIASLPTPEQREQQYQQMRPRIAQLESQLPGAQGQPSVLPPNWDDHTMSVLAAAGTNMAEQFAHAHQVGETTRLAAQGIVENAPKAADYLQKEMAAVTSPAQYKELLDRVSDYADMEEKANPGKASLWRAALKPYPEQWSPEVSQQATLSSLKPDERVKYFTGQLNDAAQRLKSAAMKGPDDYAVELNTQLAKHPEYANLFPAVAQPGQAWDAKKMADQAAKVGTTGEQFLTANNMSDYRKELIGLRSQMVGIAQQNANTRENRETAAEHKSRISALADRAIEESEANGGQGAADALKNVQNSKFYQGDEIGDARGEVAKELQSRMPKPNAKADQPSALERMQWMRDHPGQPVPATRTAMQAGAKPSAPQTPPKPAPPKPTVATTKAQGNKPQTWTVKGTAYAKGDPIKIGGKTYIFQGLDANGKIQATEQ